MIRTLKIMAAFLLALGVFQVASVPAYAAFDLFKDPCKDNPNATVCQDTDKTQNETNNSIYGPKGVVRKIVNIMSFIIGVAAVIVIIIAGIQYMTSTGDPTKTNNAKNAILYAIVGLVVALMAQVIVRFVIVRLI